MVDAILLMQQCAPNVHWDTMRRVVQVESTYNPFAIGVVGGALKRQPRSLDEAVATALWLERNGYNYSLGLAQVNKHNLPGYGLTLKAAFDPCTNLRTGAAILTNCYERALRRGRSEQAALRDSFSCYYSNNFTTGYKQGYVQRIVNAKAPKSAPILKVPALTVSGETARATQPAAAATPLAVPVPPDNVPTAEPEKDSGLLGPSQSPSSRLGESDKPQSALLF